MESSRILAARTASARKPLGLPALLGGASLLGSSVLRSLVVGSLVVGGLACTPTPELEGSGIPGRCVSDVPALSPQKTDILFVVDNSNSMAEEQAGVAEELPAFIQALRAGGGLEQDFRVGVVTTSIYEYAVRSGQVQARTEDFAAQAGRLQPVPAADGAVPADAPRFLEASDPDLVERFRRLIRQGVYGSGQETPFESALLAVTPPLSDLPLAQGGNGGFLRDGARLLVVVVTDEDDCSERARPPRVVLGTEPGQDSCGEQADALTPVSAYVEAFRALKDSTGAPREVLWASIAPVARADKRAEADPASPTPRNVDCPTSYGAGLRQREMAQAFERGLGNLDSICRETYRQTLLNIAALATAGQTVEVSNLPDARLLQVTVQRADGSVQMCTVANGGITHEPPVQEGQPGRIRFTAACARRFDDRDVQLKLLCAE